MNLLKLILFLTICLFACEVSEGWNHIAARLKQTFNSPSFDFANRQWNETKEHGYVMCGAERLLPDTIRLLYDLRITWQSNLPVAIVHCDEIAVHNQQILQIFGNLHMINICPTTDSEIFNLPRVLAVKRLRGFFCKLAAVAVSPFEHTLFLDVDTIWFQDPASLFQSRYYTRTGALFFRDRIFHHPLYEQNKPGYDINNVFALHSFAGRNITPAYVEQEYLAHEINHFWRCVKGDSYWSQKPAEFVWDPCVGGFQESSAIVIDASRHTQTRHYLKYIIEHSEYDVGYGDKEMFWIAATIANEPFVFEPFLAAQYGDCAGFVLHFHPDDASDDPTESIKDLSTIRPLYINAEYLVEYHEQLHAVGDFVGRSITAPQRVTPNMRIPPSNHCYSTHYRGNNCTCGDYPCLTASDEITKYVLRSQWLTMSFRHESHHLSEGYFCTLLLTEHLPLLAHVFTDFPTHLSAASGSSLFDVNECFVLGCPMLPLYTVTNVTEWLPGRGRLCDPIRFVNRTRVMEEEKDGEGEGEDARFVEVVKQYRRPMVNYNVPALHPVHPVMQCASQAQLYLLGEKDLVFHAIPSMRTFIKLGLDTDYVTKYKLEDCQNSLFGEPIPEMRRQRRRRKLVGGEKKEGRN